MSFGMKFRIFSGFVFNQNVWVYWKVGKIVAICFNEAAKEHANAVNATTPIFRIAMPPFSIGNSSREANDKLSEEWTIKFNFDLYFDVTEKLMIEIYRVLRMERPVVDNPMILTLAYDNDSKF